MEIFGPKTPFSSLFKGDGKWGFLDPETLFSRKCGFGPLSEVGGISKRERERQRERERERERERKKKKRKKETVSAGPLEGLEIAKPNLLSDSCGVLGTLDVNLYRTRI